MRNNLLSEEFVYTGTSQAPTRLHLCTYSATEIKETTATHLSQLLPVLKEKQVNWLQVIGMKDTGTIREVCRHFGIDFLTLQDILNVRHLTKIEDHDKYLVLILKLFTLNESENELEQEQISIILGSNFVLTFLEDESTFFDDVHTALNNDVLRIRGRQADYLLSVLLNSVMGNYMTTITDIDTALEDLEEDLLTITNNKDIGGQIQALRRQYMLMKKAVFPLKEQYTKLLRSDDLLIHKASRAFFNDVNDHLQFVLQTIDICREILSSLVDLYISNNDLRRNDIMKRLTVVSTIFIPLTFLAGIWGMNFKIMPELDWKYGYLLAWGLMLTIGIAVFWFFRKKKWY